MQSSSRFYFELFCLLLLLPTLALGECTCDAGGEEGTNKSEALKIQSHSNCFDPFCGRSWSLSSSSWKNRSLF
ncbi:hypothetical protein OIU79_013420 [Salix purpurea]|uniref:Uncharacterized protein n=1 Tax=Salix purpurea TaxID=77065 RepID=A0A9Q0Q5M0_SALPP|nr:hypothetical protein OIU79_013420 [Salix purpurea]